MKSVDLIVIGGGLAGSALAWEAHWRGWSIVIIDRDDQRTSSKVAAGLVTPITGARAAASWRWDEFYPTANRFYRQVERATGSVFWHTQPALRVYRTDTERELYKAKWIEHGSSTDLDSIRAEPFSESETRGLHIPFGACAIGPAARLDSIEYLAATQCYFQSMDAFYAFDLNCDTSIKFESETLPYPIKIPTLQLAGKRIAFCQGIAAKENRYFSDLPLHPARGDILLIESADVECDRVIHQEAWAVPMGQQRFLVGATYDRVALHEPLVVCVKKENQFREELMKRWESIAKGTFEGGQHAVLEQRWAIRPASYDRHPLIGPHDVLSNAFCLNGLGSKGTLMAPSLAEMTIDAMQGARIDTALSRSRRK